MKRILVVDDEPMLRELFSEVFRDAGYEVSLAADGAEAMERVLAESFDLMLLDVGYAWACLCGGGVFNVGCGVFAGGASRSLTGKLEGYAASLGATEFEAAPAGAPLLTFFPRGRFALANLAAVGDAAGLTRPLSGEGIVPALASGIALGRALLASPGAAGVAAYRREAVQRWGAEWRAWRFGVVVLRRPGLTRRVVAQAARHEGARRRCAELLAGTLAARRVLSPLGLLRLFLGR